MRISSKGQVTIPIEIREQAGLLPNTEVEFRLAGKVVHILRALSKKKESRGQAVVSRLRGSATVKMSTEAILSLTRDPR